MLETRTYVAFPLSKHGWWGNLGIRIDTGYSKIHCRSDRKRISWPKSPPRCHHQHRQQVDRHWIKTQLSPSWTRIPHTGLKNTAVYGRHNLSRTREHWPCRLSNENMTNDPLSQLCGSILHGTLLRWLRISSGTDIETWTTVPFNSFFEHGSSPRCQTVPPSTIRPTPSSPPTMSLCPKF